MKEAINTQIIRGFSFFLDFPAAFKKHIFLIERGGGNMLYIL